jgi:hypothetical protein
MRSRIGNRADRSSWLPTRKALHFTRVFAVQNGASAASIQAYIGTFGAFFTPAREIISPARAALLRQRAVHGGAVAGF